MSSQYILNSLVMDETFYKEFIRHNIQKNLQSKCDKIINDYGFIECYSLGLDSDRQCCYSELWLIDIHQDIHNYYLPVFIEHINTSSEYALSKCYLDNDEEVSLSLEEILEICPKSTRMAVENILKQ